MVKFSGLALILSCSIALQSCTLLKVKKVKVVHHKEANAPANVFERNLKQFKISYKKANGKNLVFDVYLENKKIKYEEKTFFVKGVEEKSLDKDKKGRFKSFFIGPAWAVVGSGAGDYFLSLGLSTVMSLGVALVIAVGDWLSLPIRVIDTDFEETRRDVKKLSTKLSESRVNESLTVILYKQRYQVENSQVEVPASALKKLRGGYKYGNLKVEYEYKGKWSQRYQRVSSVFSQEAFNELVLKQR